MKRIYFAFLTLLLCPLSGLAQGIVFETGTFAEVLAKAEKENKLVFVDFYTDWCGPCKHMTSDVFTRESVGTLFNANFINYKIDAEKGEGPEIAKKYGVNAYPTMFFLNPDGTPLHKILGAKSEDAFIDEAKGLGKAAKYGGMIKMKTEFEEGRSDEGFLKDLYKFLPASDNMRAAVAERYVLTAPKEILLSESEGDITFLGGDGGIINNISVWNDGVMSRLIDLMVEQQSVTDEAGMPAPYGGFSSDYNIGVVFSIELLGGKFLEEAINKGNGELLEKAIGFQQEFRRRLQRWVNGDGDINIFSGRGYFFASPEFLRLDFMATNKTDPERFKREIVTYMDKLMADTPPDSLRTAILPQGNLGKALKLKENIAIARMQLNKNLRRHDIAMNTFTKCVNHYWRLMPNDKKTKKTVAGWLNYTATINPHYVKGVMNTVPLLIKVGHRDDALKVLRFVIEAFEYYGFDTSRYSNPAADMIRDIESDKI